MTEDTKLSIKIIIGAVILFGIMCWGLCSVVNRFDNQSEKIRTETQQIIQECYNKTNDLEWCLINFN